MPEKIRIILVDDHVIVRDGVRQLLQANQDMEIVAEASSGKEAIAAVESIPCDVLLLDISMPDMTGVQVVQHLKAAGKLPNTLMLSMHVGQQFIQSALEAGALGYLSKGSDTDYLYFAIQRVAKGKPVVEAQSAAPTQSKSEPEKLTERESQILDLIKQGMSVNKIADTLFISPKTVSTHKVHIMAKFKVKTDAELFRTVMAD